MNWKLIGKYTVLTMVFTLGAFILLNVFNNYSNIETNNKKQIGQTATTITAESKTGTNDKLLEPDPLTKKKIKENYGKLPLTFEANEGQVDSQVQYISRGDGYNLFLTGTEAVIALRAPVKANDTSTAKNEAEPISEEQSVLRMKMVGASAAPRIKGLEPQPGKGNYFLGNDRKKWRTNVNHYARVEYRDVYPGVNVVYYGNQRQLEYDFVVAPGINPDIIKMSFEGAQDLSIDADGDLILRTPGGDIRQHKPIIYQETNGGKQEIAGRYEIKGEREIGFELAPYDTTKPLVIDPVINYSTFLGGYGIDSGHGIAVDSSGNAYVTGFTEASNFPTVNSLPYGDREGEGWSQDAFVTKLNAAGSALVYSTYLGGQSRSSDKGLGIAVDASGNAYVTGYTNSVDFPTMNPFQSALHGYGDAFVTKLNSTGSALVYSTYLGGSHNQEESRSIAIDFAGNAYVTGTTSSTDFPTANPLQPAIIGDPYYGEAFVTKLNPAGSALVYSTFLGGGSYDNGNAVAVDSSGNAYVTGTTYSNDFPTANALQSDCGCSLGNCAGNSAVFITKINPTGSAFVYSTFLGGNGLDEGRDIAVDSAGNAYVTGVTRSNNFPTVNPLQATPTGGGSSFCGNTDGFVSKINPTGSALVYSTYLGLFGVSSIAVDSSGSAYLTGDTDGGIPILDPVQSTYGGNGDAFVSKLNPAGSAFLFSSYLGGSTYDASRSIAVDSSGNAYVTGFTGSDNFPTEKPFQPVFGGGTYNRNQMQDAFVAKINTGNVIMPTPLSISAVTPNRGGNNGSVFVTIHGDGFVQGSTLKLVGAEWTDIAPTRVTIDAQGTMMRAEFNLRGHAPGVRDLTVTTPSGNSISRAQSFTVEAGGAPKLWVDIVGRNEHRPGRPQTFYVVYGNSGNVDIFSVPLWIRGIPKNATVELGNHLTLPPTPAGQEPLDWSKISPIVESPTEKILPLHIPIIRAGQFNTLKITLTVHGSENFNLRAYTHAGSVLPPSLEAENAKALDFQKKNAALGSEDPRKGCKTSLLMSALDVSEDPHKECKTSLLGFGLDIVDIFMPLECWRSVVTTLGTTTLAIHTVATEHEQAGFPQVATSTGQIMTNTTGTIITCLGDVARDQTAGKVTAGVNAALSGIGAVASCWGEITSGVSKVVGFVSSMDPNDKLGAEGVGASRYIAGEEPLRYAVYFENKPDASAPAQDVVITDQLDAAKLDFDTFSLGLISFGKDKLIVPPSGLSEFTKDVDLRPANNLTVRINAKLDKTTGLLTWRFTSLDPVTMQPTEDPRAGFLPPNVTGNEGEGQVLFTVRPKENLATGTEIRNKAKIIFDTNAPIDTPEWLNTIDNSKPASQVGSLSATQSSGSFTLNWSGTDTGSGIQSYSIFVSENGGPFNVWRQDTTETSGIFSGKADTTYAFYSVAQDKTGNKENAPATADATTLTPPPASITGKVSYGTAPAEQSKFVSGVTVSVGGVNSPTTNASGTYLLQNLTQGVNYTVIASKSGNINGISPFDATLILRHIAANGTGPNVLNANQRIAADANGDGSISPFDATQILRYVAAGSQNANTGQIGNWKFTPANRPYEPLNGNLFDQNYTAILVGEISGDWAP
ncbi:MAG TPA: SBBP repeat-containing protein [Pyrinomonadaceae bacterium]|jgi:hypothetical protein